jgi:hypothetical protein
MRTEEESYTKGTNHKVTYQVEKGEMMSKQELFEIHKVEAY